MQAEQQSERERFEAELPAKARARNEQGDYVSPAINDRWAGWQARAALSHPSPQGWISVKDRLPVEGDETVLVADKFGNVGTGDLWEGVWDCSIEIVDGDCPGYVTHWQPYPPPPEQGSSNV